MTSIINAPVHLPRAKPDHTSTRPPKSRTGLFIWRQRMWFESTFALSMLEPWEKILIASLLAITILLLLTGIFKYLPQHISLMQQRAMYYLWGQEGDQRLLWQWLGFSAGEGNSSGIGLLKEL